jgi:hypothetical protein
MAYFTEIGIADTHSGWDGFAPASNPPSDRPAFGGTCFTNIFNVPIRVTSYDSESIKASSIFTATGSLDQAFAFPYEGFALGAAVVASTTPTGSIATSTSSSTSSQADNARPTNNTGSIVGAIIGSILAALLFTGVIAFMLDYRRKRMSGKNGQFPTYASHIRLNDSSQTPMVYLSQPPKVMTEYKLNDQGQVNRYDGQEKYYELEVQNPGVYELDSAQLPITKTKKLPDLPTPDEATS